jgi:hypothetical protein
MKGKRPRMVGKKVVFNEKDIAFGISTYPLPKGKADAEYQVIDGKKNKKTNVVDGVSYVFFFQNGYLAMVNVQFTSVKVPFSLHSSLPKYESEFVDFAVNELVQYHDLAQEDLSHLIEPRLEFIMHHFLNENKPYSATTLQSGLQFMGNLVGLVKDQTSAVFSSTLKPKAIQLNTSQLYQKLNSSDVEHSLNFTSLPSPNDEYLRSMNDTLRYTMDTSSQKKDLDRANLIYAEINDILGLSANTKEVQSFMMKHMNLLFSSLLHSMHTLKVSKDTEYASSTKKISNPSTLAVQSYSSFTKHWNEC